MFILVIFLNEVYLESGVSCIYSGQHVPAVLQEAGDPGGGPGGGDVQRDPGADRTLGVQPAGPGLRADDQ